MKDKASLSALGVALAAAFLPLFKVESPDTWFHLAAGKMMWRLGQIPRTEELTWSIQGHPWQAFEWLHQAVFFGAYRLGGFLGLAMAKALLVVLTALFLLSLTRKVCGQSAVAAIMVVGMVAFARPYLVERPQLWDYAFLAVFLWSIRGFFVAENPLWLLPLPLAEMLWVNAHGGASLLGLAMVGLALVCAVRLGGVRPLLFSFLACLVATLINPWGIGVYLHAWKLLHFPIIYHLTDWLKPGLADRGFFLVLVVSVLSALFLIRREIFLCSVVLFFSCLSVQAHRHIPFLYLSASPLLASSAVWVFAPFQEGSDFRNALVTGLLVVVVLSAVGRQVWWDHLRGRRVGWGFGVPWAPEGAAQFILEKGLRGRMFNQFELGGYLEWVLWPEERAFMDGRAQLEFGQELIEQTAFWFKPEVWPGLEGRYRFDYLVVPTLTDDYRYRFLDDSKDWALVFWDDDALIYVRRTPVFESLIKSYAFQALRPNDRSLSYLQNRSIKNSREALVEREIGRSLRESPRHCVADLMSVEWSLNHGRLRPALERAQRCVLDCPWRSDAHGALSLVYQKAGRFLEAEKEADWACRLDPTNEVFLRRRDELVGLLVRGNH